MEVLFIKYIVLEAGNPGSAAPHKTDFPPRVQYKVEGENPDTPGPLPEGMTVMIPQYEFNKTKQHTQ